MSPTPAAKPARGKRKASNEDGIAIRFFKQAGQGRKLSLPRECRGLEATAFLGALRNVPLGTAHHKLTLAKHAPRWTSQGPLRQGVTLEEVAAAVERGG